MGDKNQFHFAQKHAGVFSSPFLEIGSKNYGNTQDLRSLFSSRGEYIGVDMFPGEGVDLVLNMVDDFELIDEKLEGNRFNSIFCLSVLEHCDNPFKMADNITKLLRPGGKVFISAPFSWRIHGYPSDYWRFTDQGIRLLFPRIRFDDGLCVESSSRENEFREINDSLGQVSIRGRAHREEGFWMRGLFADLFKHLGKAGFCQWIFNYRYVMRPTNLLMVGELE